MQKEQFENLIRHLLPEATDEAQGRRDIIKDSVLSAIGLPLLRLSTAGSREKQMIADALSE